MMQAEALKIALRLGLQLKDHGVRTLIFLSFFVSSSSSSLGDGDILPVVFRDIVVIEIVARTVFDPCVL